MVMVVMVVVMVVTVMTDCKGADREVTVLCVQVAMHRDNLHINNQKDASSVQKFFILS